MKMSFANLFKYDLIPPELLPVLVWSVGILLILTLCRRIAKEFGKLINELSRTQNKRLQWNTKNKKELEKAARYESIAEHRREMASKHTKKITAVGSDYGKAKKAKHGRA